jgi:peptide/nickel transport system permease protein
MSPSTRTAATPVPASGTEPLLAVEGLSVGFPEVYGDVAVLDQISFSVAPGETVGLVGESGCGKSLLGLSIMGLEPRGARVQGAVRLGGRDLRGLSGREHRAVLGSDVAMIYQDALTSLNPGMTIKAQMRLILGDRTERPLPELLEMVALADSARVLNAYPHQLSGGQRQRVLIAMALAGRPSLVVADEPTTALDVTVQAQVMELIASLRREIGFALLFVSHDLGLVSQIADRVMVMYAGHVIEDAAVGDVVAAPRHPYTAGLLAASLSLEEGRERLAQIPGVVPSPAEFPSACRYRTRCPRETEVCREVTPPLADGVVGGRHRVACHHPLDGEGAE